MGRKRWQEVSTEYVYVKDLPEPIRAGRMAKLREAVFAARDAGHKRCVAIQLLNGSVEYVGTTEADAEDCRGLVQHGIVVECYDLTKDLGPQFAERRALHW